MLAPVPTSAALPTCVLAMPGVHCRAATNPFCPPLPPPPPPRCCLAGGRRLLLSGVGATPEGYKPFLDTLDLTSRKTERLWKVRDKPGGERTRGVSSVQSDARVEATAAGSPFFKFVSFFGRGFGRPCSARRASSSESGL